MDGTPRVVPIWFHWNGRQLVMVTPPKALKLKPLAQNPKVSLTIDDYAFPHKVLLIRGTASLQQVDGIVPECAAPRNVILDASKGWPGSCKSAG